MPIQDRPKRRRLFQLPPKNEPVLDVQEQSDMPEMTPDLTGAGFNQTENVQAPAEDSLKDRMTRSVIKMLKKKGPPKASP